MDYPTAIAIAVPTSTFIIMVGKILIKRKNPSGGHQMSAITRKEIDGLLKEKLDASLCEERVKRIEGSFGALKEFIEQQFEWIRERLEKIP